MLYTIEDKTLTALGDAVRNKVIGQSEPFKEIGDTGWMDWREMYVIKFDSVLVKSIKIKGVITNPNSANINGNQKLYIVSGEYKYTTSFELTEEDKIPQLSNENGATYEFEAHKQGNVITLGCSLISDSHNMISVSYEAVGLDENGNEFKYTPLEMVEVINGLDTIPSSVLNITGNGQYRFSYNSNNWLIEQVGNKITTNNIYDATSMFSESDKLEEIPFEINLDNNAKIENMFKNCNVLTTIPQVNITRTIHNSFSGLFNYCKCMTEIPEWCVDLLEQDYNIGGSNNTFGPWSSMFANCYSLREIPERAIRAMWSQNPSGNYYTLAYSKPFNGCYALDRLVGLCCDDYAFTSNQFNNFCQYLYHIEDFTFATQEDGSPYIRGWKSQTIDLSSYIGFYNRAYEATDYASGLTTATQITDDATYQALKDNPDSWTADINYSRYNHDAAVRTIMSLPDCSAKGGNTIKFKGAAGAKTDGGAINTLTEEEIAVAAAKGWTVSLS